MLRILITMLWATCLDIGLNFKGSDGLTTLLKVSERSRKPWEFSRDCSYEFLEQTCGSLTLSRHHNVWDMNGTC